jgi:DNA replication and repair protein RecF
LKLSSICLRQFRSYAGKVFSFAPEGAIILGANGSGKTNLFEAIAYCSLGKSVRYQADEQLLFFNSKEFAIQADFQLLSGKCNVKVHYTSGKKNIQINQISVKQLSRIYEYVKAIYCSPDDVQLVNGSPRKRRQYFDMAIAQLEPQYIQWLRAFLHIAEQRNALLKDNANQPQKKQWDEQYIQAALPVIGQRLKYIEMLNRKIKEKYSETISEADILQIIYQPTLNPVTDNDPAEKYISILKKIEQREWQYQRSLIGPHLDDYDILLDSRAVRDIGSQGQKRTITLLIKIAQLELIKDAIGEYPILLLDDIFAELDERHTKEFMYILQNHEQVFIASPKAISSADWHNLPVIMLDTPDT